QGPTGRGREKGRLGRRRRLAGAPGRGTLEKDKPPILGLIRRGGQVVLQMLANVQQKTIQPIIETMVAQNTLIYTDEYDIYARLEAWVQIPIQSGVRWAKPARSSGGRTRPGRA